MAEIAKTHIAKSLLAKQRGFDEIDPRFYERHGYEVMVSVTLRHLSEKGQGRVFRIQFIDVSQPGGRDHAKAAATAFFTPELLTNITSIGFVDVHRLYLRAVESLPKRKALYTAKDVNRCFPWLKATTINHRIKAGYMSPAGSSSQTGVPNTFTLAELVHCAVIDDLSALGALNDLKGVTTFTVE